MSQMHEPSALKKAEPWLRQNAESLLRCLVDSEDDDQRVEKVLFQLKKAYCEGYSDRLKDEVTETKSIEAPKKARRKRK